MHDYQVEDLWQFFKDNGTRKRFVSNNRPAFEAWCEMLELRIESSQDMNLIQIIQKLCMDESKDRLTAPEVLNELRSLPGPPYFGICCSQDLDSAAAPSLWSEHQIGPLDDNATIEGVSQSGDSTVESTAAKQFQVTVEDAETTVQIPPKTLPVDSTHVLEEVENQDSTPKESIEDETTIRAVSKETSNHTTEVITVEPKPSRSVPTFKINVAESSGQATGSNLARGQQDGSRGSIRFSELPEAIRPRSLSPVKAIEIELDNETDLTAEMPTRPLETDQKLDVNEYGLPSSTFVPSYILGMLLIR